LQYFALINTEFHLPFYLLVTQYQRESLQLLAVDFCLSWVSLYHQETVPLFYSSPCSAHSAKLNPQYRKMHLVIEHWTIFGQEHLLLNPQLIGSQPFLEYRDTVSITEYTQILSLPGSFGLWELNWNRACLLIGKCT